jgi:predicted GIY-YIG superfamily endonuclease
MLRIAQHSGLTPTKGARLTRKQPLELVYLEQFKSRKKALQREWQLKHESPYNQKKHKLKLIEDFNSNYGHILLELNEKLVEHFKFLTTLIKTMKSVEKRIIGEMKTTPV